MCWALRGRVGDEIKEGLSQQGQAASPRPQQGTTGPEAEFKEVNEAYECLKDDQRKGRL